MVSRKPASLIIGLTLLTSAVIALSNYYDAISTDAIITYLASLLRWTPFFWSQDRYGMLIPALTRFITDPFANMIVQNWLHASTTIFSLFLLARYFFPGKKASEIGILSVFFFLLLSDYYEIKATLTPWQIYTPAIMLGLLSLELATQNLVIAVIIGILAQWANFSVILFLGLLVISRSFESAARKGWPSTLHRFLGEMATLLLSGSASLVLRHFYSIHSVGYDLLPWHEAITGWLYFFKDYYETATITILYMPPALGSLFVLGYTCYDRQWNSKRPDLIRNFILAQFVGFTYAMIVGSSQFAAANGFPKRYLLPSLMVWTISWVGLAYELLPTDRLRLRLSQQAKLATGFALVMLLCCLRFGFPLLSHVRSSLDERFAKNSQSIDSACTHVAGNYYRTWDAMYYSILKKDRTIWAITFRSEVIKDLWDIKNFKDPVVCYWLDDTREAMKWMRTYQIHDLDVASVSQGMVILKRTRPAQANQLTDN